MYGTVPRGYSLTLRPHFNLARFGIHVGQFIDEEFRIQYAHKNYYECSHGWICSTIVYELARWPTKLEKMKCVLVVGCRF